MVPNERQQRVAVVGSGMAGLTTAMLLNGDREGRYDVTVFESVRITGFLTREHLIDARFNTRASNLL